jgi:hypothetical protein
LAQQVKTGATTFAPATFVRTSFSKQTIFYYYSILPINTGINLELRLKVSMPVGHLPKE